MRYNVAQLLKSQTGAVRQYKIHDDITDLDPAITPLSALDGEALMLKTVDGILVSGDLHTSVELSCSRCLDLFAMPVHINFQEEFRPSIDIVTGAKIPVAEGDEVETRIDIHHILDLNEVIRQNLVLSLPMFPICRSKCKGLCQKCGQNWNVGSCECTLDELDPRLAVLKQLLE